MTRRLPLSVLLTLVQETIEDRFFGEAFWITAEITDVKKYEQKRWCFLKFVEKHGETVAAEMQAVFWANGYQHIKQFETLTRQSFRNGIELTCLVAVKFHVRYGLKLEVLEIDTSYAIGQIELQRRQTLERLVNENPGTIKVVDDAYLTFNNSGLKLAKVLQRIALITAAGSDGQRDFREELQKNNYGYRFKISEFTCAIQGDTAAAQIGAQLQLIFSQANHFDVLAIVRGGGSQTDFAAFDTYDIAKLIAAFPIPVFTGIGHDRNTSIVDLMARQFKTPTKVAAAIVDHNFIFENEMLQLKDRLNNVLSDKLWRMQQNIAEWKNKMEQEVQYKAVKKIQELITLKHRLGLVKKLVLDKHYAYLGHQQFALNKMAKQKLLIVKEDLQLTTRLVNQLSPETILNKGFAAIKKNGKFISNPDELLEGDHIAAIFKTTNINATVINKTPYENTDF